MDIFTTQLTRVAPNRLKPEKLRVKGMLKESAAPSLDEEHDHIDEHEQTTLTEQHARQQYKGDDDVTYEALKEDKNEGLDRGSIEGNNKQHRSTETNAKNEDDDEPTHHLDIFV